MSLGGPMRAGRPGSNRRRLAWEASLPTVSDPRLRHRPLNGASKRRRCRARQAYQGVTPNDPGPLVTRSLEVATPPSTGAVSLESAQHLTGRKSPHAVVVFVGERFAQGAGPLPSYPIRTPAKDRALPRAWRSSCRCSVKPAV